MASTIIATSKTRQPRRQAAIKPLVCESQEWHWIATGQREQLLEAGLCAPSHFPAGRQRINHWRDGSDRHWTLKAQRGGSWRLAVMRTLEEREAFQKAEVERRIIQRYLDALPRTADHWLARQIAIAEGFAAAWVSSIPGAPHEGYALDDVSRRAIEALLARIVNVIRSARVIDDPARREALIQRLQSEPATAVAAEIMCRRREPLRVVT